MTAKFKYTAMTVTGALHLALGILCFIISIVGFSIQVYQSSYDYRNGYYIYVWYPSKGTAAGAFIVSLWIIAVGIIGIITGQKSNSNSKTEKMRLLYLIFTLLSATVFSLGGMTAFTIHGIWMDESSSSRYVCILFFFGVFLMIMEFVLAIVSSSICCCCSGIEEITVATRVPGVNQTNVLPYVVPPSNAAHLPPQYTACPSDAGAQMPPQYTVCPSDAGAQMPPQYTACPSDAGAQMPPQYNAFAPNVAENAMPISKTQ